MSRSTEFAARNHSIHLVGIEHLEARTLFSTTGENADPTVWHWYHNIDPATLTQTLASDNSRVVDLKVQTISPLTFEAAVVANIGSYASQSWWTYNQTASQVTASLAAHNARLVGLDPYVVNGKVLFATVQVPGTARTWWYAGQTASSIRTHLSQNNGRLIDIEPYVVGGTTYYADVMIANTGGNARTWNWYAGVTPATLNSQLTATSSRLMSLSYQANGTLDAITQKNDGTQSFWYSGKSAADLNTLAAQDGARIFNVDSSIQAGATICSAILINNSNALETTIGNIVRGANSSATSGAFLQAVDGPVLANLNGEKPFEPASSIKLVAAVTALRAVEAQTASLDEPITYYYNPLAPKDQLTNPDSFAHTPANAITVTLQNAIAGMLQNSDNRMTFALELRFGLPAFNATAALIGMTSTVWTQTVGSGIPGNFTTLADISLLYSKVLDGSLLDPINTQLFQTLMLNQTNYGIDRFLPVIHQEAAKVLGVALGSAAELQLTASFAANILWGSKAGTYYLDSASTTTYIVDRSHEGYFSLPVNVNGVLQHISYTYAVFIDNAVVALPKGTFNSGLKKIEDAMASSTQEIVRGVIHSALLLFK